MGPDGLLEEEVLKGATCDAALATDMRITFASLPFEKMKGIGAKTYENYKKKYGKEPTAYALYAAEAARIAIDGIKRAAADDREGRGPDGEARGRPEGHRRHSRTTRASTASGASTRTATPTIETMSGFKVVKATSRSAASSSSSPSSNSAILAGGRAGPRRPSRH